MPSKKIVIKINYNPTDSNNFSESVSETKGFAEWNVKRILVALFLLVGAGILIYFWSWGTFTQDGQNFATNSQTSVTPESLEMSGQSSDSNSLDREQENVLKKGVTGSDQEPILDSKRVLVDAGHLAMSQRKRIERENAAKDRKKWIRSLKIKRAQFTSDIKNKEPVDNLTSPFFALRKEAYSIYFFTELKRLKGDTVTHIWKHKGQVKSNKEFEVRGNRWRVYTSKLLNMSMLGQWDVLVVDSSGRILEQKSFELKAPMEPKG